MASEPVAFSFNQLFYRTIAIWKIWCRNAYNVHIDGNASEMNRNTATPAVWRESVSEVILKSSHSEENDRFYRLVSHRKVKLSVRNPPEVAMAGAIPSANTFLCEAVGDHHRVLKESVAAQLHRKKGHHLIEKNSSQPEPDRDPQDGLPPGSSSEPFKLLYHPSITRGNGQG